MGNRIAKFTVCFSGAGDGRRRQRAPFLIDDPLDEGLGHSFCYVRPEPVSLSKVHSDETTTFRSISGAAVSANTSTPLSTAFVDKIAAAFESSDSFASIPLQPISRALLNSGPISDVFSGSGPIERGFLSGPIERGFMSGPLDRGLFSGPLDKSKSRKFQRSFSHGGLALRLKSRRGSLSRILKRAASKATYRSQNSIVAPIKKEPECVISSERSCENANLSLNLRREGSLNDGDSLETQNLQWAQGKAGEDRVHVVVSEEHGWVFVGIYDGFNGPDATDYLLTNLYSAVQRELKGLLWDDQFETSKVAAPASAENCDSEAKTPGLCECDDDKENHLCGSGDVGFDWNSRSEMGKNMRSKYRGAGKKWVDNQRRWRWQWERERIELDRRLKEHLSRSASNNSKVVNHEDVLKALSRALRKTEEAYLAIADKMVMENPELALMGSCVLVMLMKGEDVYVMNIGDSRAVLAQQAKPDYLLCKIRQDLERIKEETLQDLETADCDRGEIVPSLTAFQLSIDHSTSMKEEVQRIRNEHPDDACAVVNDRVKGSLKVTRAFGAGFLKQPKWNEALIEIFRVHYIGTSPYITCFPSLYHHRLGPNDRFLILSSDGLYQYFTNEEAVSEVELFISSQPEGDPAQHLVEEVLFRAAKKAGMDLGELLEIAQGDRRRYHDDLSIIVISLEGRIWRSCA